MKTLASEYPLVELCQALGLSRSGYYHWLNRPDSRRAKANRELLDKIKVLHQENRRRYGSPRMTTLCVAKDCASAKTGSPA
jgi:hypothetical protein